MSRLPNTQADENHLTQDYLYELRKETLEVLRHYLCEHLQPEKLFPLLQSKKILTTADCEEIRSLTTTNKKVDKLIDIIKRTGPNCLLYLQKAIEISNKSQLFIVKKLEETYNTILHDPLNQEKLQSIETFPCDPPPPYSQGLKQPSHQRPEPPPGFSFSNQSKVSVLSNVDRPTCNSQRGGTDNSSVIGLSTSPLPSSISQVASTGTFFRTVSHFHTADYPTENITSSIMDQREKERWYGEGGVSVATEDQSMEFQKIRSRSMKSHREPSEHDANLSYSPSLTHNINETKASSLARSPHATENSDDSCNGHIPAVSSTENSYTLRVPPYESFEVSDGDI